MRFREQFFRACHAHAGVLLILSLVYYLHPDRTGYSDRVKWIAGGLLQAGILAQSGGFFIHVGLGQPNRSSPGTAVTRLGAVLIAAALGILAVGLLRSENRDPYYERSANQRHTREPPFLPSCLEGLFCEIRVTNLVHPDPTGPGLIGSRASTCAHIYPAPQYVVLTCILEGAPVKCFENSRDDSSIMLYPTFAELPFHALQ
jgi:hypothetical protein